MVESHYEYNNNNFKKGYHQESIENDEYENPELYNQTTTEEFVNIKEAKLKRIFQFYASHGESMSTVTLKFNKFKKLLKECGILRVIFIVVIIYKDQYNRPIMLIINLYMMIKIWIF